MDLHRNAIIVDYLYIRELLYWQLPCRVNLQRPKVWNLKLRRPILTSWIELPGEESANLQRRPDKVQLYKPAHVISTQQQDFVETLVYDRLLYHHTGLDLGSHLTSVLLAKRWVTDGAHAVCLWSVDSVVELLFSSLAWYLQKKKTYQASISFIILQNRSNSCWLCNRFGGPLLRFQKFNLIYR